MPSKDVAVRPGLYEDGQQKTSNDQAKDTSNVMAAVIWLLSVLTVAFDPFFFYIPVVKNASTCLGYDNNLRIVIVVLRSFVDVLHTVLWWRHSLRSDRGRNRLIQVRTVAILAILPLPQVVILAVYWQLLTVKLLKYIVLIQIFIRLYRIIPAFKDAPISSDTYPWIAAAFCFIMYTIASNVFGAFWYLRAIERNMDCWKEACHKNRTLCVGSSLYCDHTSRYNGFLHKHCSVLQASSRKSFDYGIYDEAFQAIINKTDIHFLDKFFQCFWWGLRNMSSYGQNLKTGTHIWDTFFAVVIGSCGLILFAFFIGNMQNFMEMGTKKTSAKESEEMKQIQLTREDPLREVNPESLLHNIPTALREKVKSCLCKDMFKKVPEFSHLNKLPRKELCNRARPVVYPERSYILREGDLITEIILILHGDSLSYTEHDENEVAFQFHRPSKDNYLFFGHELIQHWLPSQKAAMVTCALGLPIAQRSIKALTKVEAFVISAIDLKSIFDEYQGILYSPSKLYGSQGII